MSYDWQAVLHWFNVFEFMFGLFVCPHYKSYQARVASFRHLYRSKTTEEFNFFFL